MFCNFEVKTLEKRDNVIFINARKKPFVIYGLMHENGRFRRMPEKVAFSVSEAVSRLHAHTAGGRVRFVTNSKRIAIIARFIGEQHAPHMPFSNQGGIDIYIDHRYSGTFMPPTFMPSFAFESLKTFDGNFILQTMFLKSPYFDTVAPEPLARWMNIVRELNPREIMVYTIDRETPDKSLGKYTVEEMTAFVQPLLDEGYKIQIRG